MHGSTNADRICELLARQPDLDDDEISRKTGIKPRQQVNQICRRLERQGQLRRFPGFGGKIVNRLVAGQPATPVSAGLQRRTSLVSHIRDAVGERTGSGRTAAGEVETAPLTRQSGVSLAPHDLASTLIVLPCSGSKNEHPGRREPGLGVAEQLPAALAQELELARRAVRHRAQIDESTLVPAWRRYSGSLYQSAGGALEDAVAAGMKILILSGGYGVVLATEPVGFYKAVLQSSWWPRGLLERVLLAYASSERVTAVRAFASASTAYRRVVENTPWERTVSDAVLLMPESVGGGAMRKTPRAQGEALAALLSGSLTTGWRSSDGIGLESLQLA